MPIAEGRGIGRESDIRSSRFDCRDSSKRSSMRYALILPDLGLGDREIVLSTWLVAAGSEVSEGDRVAEVLADGVTVDLPAPASGVLIETLVDEDEPLEVGQTLAFVDDLEAAAE
jgi:2-oxoglutarate dehydrogenase E2 component (dihydrolipoamide succinyltransferase)